MNYIIFQLIQLLYYNGQYIISSIDKIKVAATNFCHNTSFMTISQCENLVVVSRFHTASHVQMSHTWQPFDTSKNKLFLYQWQHITSKKTFCRFIPTFCFDLSSYQNIQKTLLAATLLWMLCGTYFLFTFRTPWEIAL